MEFRGHQLTALGVMVVVAVLLFVWGMFYLLGNPVLAGGMNVAIAMEHGAGLKRGDRVQLNGVTVGSVRRVELDPSRRVVVEINLENGLDLAADTRALVKGDVFGAHTVDLVPGTALVRLQANDTIRGSGAPELTDLVGDLSGRASAVLSNAESFLSPDVVADVHATAAVLPESAAELQAAVVEVRKMAEALRRTAEDVERAGTAESITGVLSELETSLRSFGQAAESLNRTLGTMDQSLATMDRSFNSIASVLDKIDRGEGTLGKLVNDTLLYRDLHETVREMRMLTRDIQEQPGKYINLRIF